MRRAGPKAGRSIDPKEHRRTMQIHLALAVLVGLPVSLAAQQYPWVRSPVNGHEYALTSASNWHDAETAAQAVGAHLATIRSPQEQQWIEAHFGTNENLWIGLNDEATEGSFVWASGEDSTWRNWCPNEPNGRPDEDFVHLAAFPGQCFGGWNDVVGSRSYRGLIERVPVVFDWRWRSPVAAPDARFSPGSAYDPLRGVAVVAGGLFSLAGTLEWDGRTWTATAGAPFALTQLGMAFDGRSVIAVADGKTWRWDGAVWSDLGAVGTPAVAGIRLAYDSARDRVVGFGGVSLVFASDDTWEWDGASWTLMSPAHRPPGRLNHALTYDEVAGEVLLFGGQQNLPATFLQDTWSWNGVDWVQRTSSTAPPARGNHSLTAIDGTGLTVLCGGYDGATVFGDLWIWDGETWAEPVAPTGTAQSRFMHTAFCFPGIGGQEVVLYGGSSISTALTDLQVLDSVRPFASYRLRGAGCAGSTAPAFGFDGLPSFGAPFTLRAENLPTYQATVLMFGFGEDFGGQPLPLDLAPLGMPGCALYCSADVALAYVSSPAGRVDATFTVPQDPGLLGLYFNNQFFVRDPGANALGVTATGGGEGAFGR
jgi:hypothetical protein